MKLDAVKWGGALLLMLSLMAGSAWAAWAWQDNAYGKQLAKQESAHQTALTHLFHEIAKSKPASIRR